MLPRSGRRTPGPACARAVLAVLAVGALCPLAGPATAAPSDQPGGTSGVLDSRALDRLQQRAAEVQTGLQAQQGEVAAARDAMARAEAEVVAAEAVLAGVEGELEIHQREVAGYGAAVYRDGAAITPLTLLLSGGDPGEVLAAMGFLDVVDAHAAEVIGIAEAQRQAALAEQRRAAAALAEARARADEVGARVAELEAPAGAVTEELDAALGEVDRQLARLQQEQVEVNSRTAATWQAYLAELAAAGVAAPPAAALRNPPGGLPPGMVPVAAADGSAQRGAAQVPRQPSSLLVLV